MKIEFTEEQYRKLIMMVNMANGVLGLLGDHIEDKKYKEISDRAEEVENYLLGFSKDFDCGDLVENWKGKIVLNDRASKKFQEIMDDYDDFILFDSLANKLAWRDFRKTYSEEEINKMVEKSGGYFGVEIYNFEKKYWDEFDVYGLDRLEIKKDNT